MDVARRVAFGRQITRPRDFAISESADLFQFADRAVADHFPHAIEIGILMTLSANLRRDFVFVLEPGLANDTGFFDAVDERLFAEDVFIAIHRPIDNKGVGMIERAADDGVNVLLFKAYTP